MKVSDKISARIDALKVMVGYLDDTRYEHDDFNLGFDRGKASAKENEIDFLVEILVQIVMDEDKATEASFREEMIREDAERSAREKW